MRAKPADVVERSALSFTGLALLASAALTAQLAAAHMQAAGRFCGAAPMAHCAWCAAAVALGIAGVTALAFAAKPRGALHAIARSAPPR